MSPPASGPILLPPPGIGASDGNHGVCGGDTPEVDSGDRDGENAVSVAGEEAAEAEEDQEFIVRRRPSRLQGGRLGRR